MGWGQGGGLGTARWAGGDGDGAGKSLTVATGWAWWCPPTYKGVQELGGGTLGNTAGSTHSGVGAEHGTSEALPKDEAINCYLSNQAVSRLPGVRQWQWKVSRCQSEEWHWWGPSVLGDFQPWEALRGLASSLGDKCACAQKQRDARGHTHT